MMAAQHHFYSSNPAIPAGYAMIRVECYVPRIRGNPGAGFGRLFCFYNGVKHYFNTSSAPPAGYGRAEEHDTHVMTFVLERTSELADLLEYYNAGADDHFYTAERSDPPGYSGPLVKGVVYARAQGPRQPLYRFYNPVSDDHFYQRDWRTPPGYALEGIEGYVSAVRQAGWVPLRRFWSAGRNDHYYTIGQPAPGKRAGDYQEEAPEGFVSPVAGPGLAQLHRYVSAAHHFYSLDPVAPPGYREEGPDVAPPIFVYADAGADRLPWFQYFQLAPPPEGGGLLDAIGSVAEGAISFVGGIGSAAAGFFTDVLDTAEDILDGIVDGIRDGIRDGVEWLDRQSPALGWMATVLGGAIDGFLGGVQDLYHDVFDLGRDGVRIFGASTRFDAADLTRAAGDLLLDGGTSIADAVRMATGGYIIGGIARGVRRTQLRHFVAELVDSTFIGAARDAVRGKIGLDSGTFGYRLPAQHRVFVLDSATVPLRLMHFNGTLDLYSMAGYVAADLGAHPRAVVKTVDASGGESVFPATRSDITSFLEGRGRLRLYAMSARAVTEKLDTARRKLDEIGVVLKWSNGTDIAALRHQSTFEINGADYELSVAAVPSLLERAGRVAGANCSLLALGAFRIIDRFGFCEGRGITDGAEGADCAAKTGRTDSCCSLVEHDVASGVVHRDFAPTDPGKFVLAHEIGHYLGLCHYGHDGLQNIMYSPRENSWLDAGLLRFYLESEPSFTLEDGKNAWRFLFSELRGCFWSGPAA